MDSLLLIFPHQLYELHSTSSYDNLVWVEEPLFFSQYRFHKQKLMLHRASMKYHFDRTIVSHNCRKWYLEHSVLGGTENSRDSRGFVDALKIMTPRTIVCYELNDDYLHRKVTEVAKVLQARLTMVPSPNFLTEIEVIDQWANHRKKWFFTQFYMQQRSRLGVLMDGVGKPVGGKWSFDTENRKKLPKSIAIPEMQLARSDSYTDEARVYVRKHFPAAIGDDSPLMYPYEQSESRKWLDTFLSDRFRQFGEYEDAISSFHPFLFHSVLTPTLNIGLLSPDEIVQSALEYSEQVPIQSLEGFLRQVIGWREYMRAVYLKLGRVQRTRNFWNHHRKIPSSFYSGTTGILPVDQTIRTILKYGYCHHIERLMILGNFMLLCEFSPDEIYQWFMELFVDSYDWVMVPNVYGMSQHADGGLITTKPYLSGSSYILKMSNYTKGDWCPIWDGLYWRFMHENRSFFEKNPRMSVMTRQLDKMGSKLDSHLRSAESFLRSLDSQFDR